jgi:DNA-binding phage protein
MALTRDFKQSIQDRVNRDPKFAALMLSEAADLLLGGDPGTARLMLRDLVNATLGFEELASATSIPAKSLHRMLSATGNPSMTNLAAILGVLQERTNVSLQVSRKNAYEDTPEHSLSVSENVSVQLDGQPYLQAKLPVPSGGAGRSGERCLNVEFEVRGLWWLHDQAKRQIPGTLKFGPDRIILYLEGVFGAKDRREPLDEKCTICGIDTTTRRWTLTRALEVQMNPGYFGGHKTSEFVAELAFEGAHISSEEKLKVSTLSIALTGVEQSLGESGFDFKYPNPSLVSITYKKPPGLVVDIPEIGGTLEVVRFCSGSFERYGASVRSSARLELGFPSLKYFSAVSNHMFHLSNFVSLLHAIPTNLIDVRLVAANEEQISVYFVEKSRRREPIDHQVLLVPLSSLKNHFGSVLNNWFSLNEKALTAVSVFCNLWRKPAPFGQSDFMQFVQTLESFHRSMSEHEFLSKAEYKRSVITPLKEAIDACEVSDELRDNLVEQVKFANRLSQRSRLRRLYESLPNELAHQLAPNATVFVSRVVDTRNYLTHLDTDYKHRSMQGNQIPFATAGLQVFFIMLVLTRLGVPAELIQRNLANTLLFRTFKHRSPW